ncbi:hypothetical protein AUEXF2481DRAFT_36634 [Aureobasidium subglaciale EXF-2481]|uniref:Uncharacterized protein n=1 Tax=Aureobasidium subglaciale (strain EXF-2481) TaxID=1043005 RepID=A0A074YVF7_AURSE|nr:uncharacterized protein AUEXF2481DRAFT_36634 [Aureobasidium subglaciale EXF-2481]KEQ98137.1 hypothetical protein AUEXF2481DRAFT_36634 [Aureobasidium subglaciale EXF-2481]
MEIISRTTTLSDVPTSTVTVISTKSIVSSSTATTFTTSAVRTESRRVSRVAACGPAENILSGLDNAELSEACSCIGALPSVEAAMLAVSPSTTTMTAEVWSTVAPRVTESSTQTVSIQSIITVEKAAPSFTQVWGPKAGCDDIGMASAQTFMVATMTEEQVTNICKATCMKQANCVFLYVQSIYPANNFWNCYINTHGFDEEKDLECSKDTSIWGMAKGYSVVDRE